MLLLIGHESRNMEEAPSFLSPVAGYSRQVYDCAMGTAMQNLELDDFRLDLDLENVRNLEAEVKPKTRTRNLQYHLKRDEDREPDASQKWRNIENQEEADRTSVASLDKDLEDDSSAGEGRSSPGQGDVEKAGFRTTPSLVEAGGIAAPKSAFLHRKCSRSARPVWGPRFGAPQERGEATATSLSRALDISENQLKMGSAQHLRELPLIERYSLSIMQDESIPFSEGEKESVKYTPTEALFGQIEQKASRPERQALKQSSCLKTYEDPVPCPPIKSVPTPTMEMQSQR